MTIAQLIARLQKYDEAMPVLVDGYGDGYDEIGCRVSSIRRVEREDWWSGRFEEHTGGIEALILERVKPAEQAAQQDGEDAQ